MQKLHETHDKHNAEYISAKAELFKTKPSDEALRAVASGRLDQLTEMLGAVEIADTGYVQSIDTLVSFFDDIVCECAIATDRRAEIEEKILALCKTALDKSTEKRDKKNEHVTAALLDSLTLAPSAEASAAISAALLDSTNPLRLGLTRYIAFCEQNPNLADPKSLDYLKTEAAIRESLFFGNDKATSAAVERLLTSPIDCPEKYLLVSLTMYYYGYEADAKAVLERGLGIFPKNERLVSAKNSL
ncbi:MAG: hypothetical protein FWG87_15090 [Defluviitaleaceae bacterium]|nr:hypothetical protein [Defluviitaleaceae bacterium]